ncbi:hypothetical protein ASG67_09625 [Sphingomonas sp. Leaf339]|uniref:tail completion protein gp17 n=1 Tax=Sphingomonas sp. Leaf339 TaxID=1736343 RepID=UPI0006FD1C01|nr:DUF3168 domain-containing protein [Sphingomonas sp. Leaf339]KQU53089.1 hypothetical protein ASG67_09625 [Sphingomonas sp. Leaf339]
MSARDVLMAAVVARVRALPRLQGVTVFDAPPVRAGLPYVLVEEPVLAATGAQGWRGVEGRLTVTLADAGERPVRLRGLVDAVERGLATMPAAIGDGWRLGRMRLVRSRLVGSGGGDRWTGSAEFQLTMWRQDGETER